MHYVLFRLLRQGTHAALAPPGARKGNILVHGADNRMTATIRVHTTAAGVNHGWRMGSRHEDINDPQTFYAFVDIKPPTPVTYIVPSQVVADILSKSHETWKAAPGAKGQPHVDNPVRKFAPKYNPPVPDWGHDEFDQFRENWDLLRAAAP
jgi:hypothetical protein